MIWGDKISDILTVISASSVYSVNNSSTPTGLDVIIYNQVQDWLCMYKPWRDLRVDAELVLGADKKGTLPADFGSMMFVYTDPSNIGKPMYFYTLNDNDVARRYTEEVTRDAVTGIITRKLAWPPTVFLPSNPHIVYSKVLESATVADRTGTRLSFFPINVMSAVSKKILQDYYGVPGNQDPNWINLRVQEELKSFEGYAYNNNVSLDMSVKDRFGNPVFIQGGSLDGSKPRLNRPSPFLPSTLYSGGTL
jgi:hypothetical protein